MLGQLTSKQCYYRSGGCTINYSRNWRYDAIGAAAYTSEGVVTRGYSAIWCAPVGSCYTYTFSTWPWSFPRWQIVGARFPWTTGSVTVTAVGSGRHKTIHYAKGYDNRTPTSGMGTIQLVTPVLTRWKIPLCSPCDYETGGIGILRLKFVPEPRGWLMLVAGVSCLGVFHRWR
jgi:hypothetical protein